MTVLTLLPGAKTVAQNASPVISATLSGFMCMTYA